MGVSGHSAYVALKQWHPPLTADLEACVELGGQPDEILAKTREFTPVEVPDYVWEYIRAALEFLVLERDARSRRN